MRTGIRTLRRNRIYQYISGIVGRNVDVSSAGAAAKRSYFLSVWYSGQIQPCNYLFNRQSERSHVPSRTATGRLYSVRSYAHLFRV